MDLKILQDESYLDKFNLISHAKGDGPNKAPVDENHNVFSIFYIVLNLAKNKTYEGKKLFFDYADEVMAKFRNAIQELGYLPQSLVDNSKASHDNITAQLCVDDLAWYEVPKYFVVVYRDPLFFFATKFRLSKLLLWIPAISYIHGCFPSGKIRPFYFKRKWIKKHCKYEHTVPLPDGGTREFWRKPNGETIVISHHGYSLDGELLNVFRFYKLKMKLTAWICHKMCTHYHGTEYLYKFALIYYENDSNHPNVQAAKGMTYLDLVN